MPGTRTIHLRAQALYPPWASVQGAKPPQGGFSFSGATWVVSTRAHLFALLLQGHQIDRIKYFTAHVTARPNDPDQPPRQQIYLRALRTLPKLDIILGHYLTHAVMMPLANPAPGQSRYVRVLKSEEKGSDVNLATHLVHDAHCGLFEVAVIVSNDSDLLEAVKIVKSLGRQVGILNPHANPSRVLLREATFMKKIRGGPLSVSQFPSRLTDAHGTFHKPRGW